jgi:hypothetical protein
LRFFEKELFNIKATCSYPDVVWYSKKNNPETVVREYVEDKSKWDQIFRDINIDGIFNSLIHKIKAVVILRLTEGSFTPGVDVLHLKEN